MIRWRGFLITVMLISLAATAWSVEVSRSEERTIDFAYGGTISVTADEGDIIIRGWDKEEVHLKITKHAYARSEREAEYILDRIEIRIQESKDRLIIREEHFDSRHRFNFFDVFERDFWREGRWRSAVVDYELMVPRRIEMNLESDEGDVDVNNTEGPMSIEVDEGDVVLESVSSDDLEIRVDEGFVDVNDVEGTSRSYWKMETDEGTIRIENAVVSEMDIGTDEGEIIAENIEVEEFWLSADEGDIEIDFLPAEDGDYRIQTDEGDVDVILPEDANLGVRIRSEEGRIDSDFDLSIRRHNDSETMEGVIGRKEGSLRATTDDGDIIIRRSR